MTLHSVAPETPQEDELKIGKGYQVWLNVILLAGPIIAFQFLSFEYVVVGSIGVALLLLHEAGGRLYELCIRLRRTNVLLQREADRSR